MITYLFFEKRNKGETRNVKNGFSVLFCFHSVSFFAVAMPGDRFCLRHCSSLLPESRVSRFAFQMIVRSQKKMSQSVARFSAKVIISPEIQASMQANMPAYI